MRSLLRTSASMSLRINALERGASSPDCRTGRGRRSAFVILAPKGFSLLESMIPGDLIYAIEDRV